MWTLAIALLPLATVFALEFTTPAWTTLLAVLFLGERITGGRLTALVCGLVGVLVIVRPGWLRSNRQRCSSSRPRSVTG